MTTIWRDSPGRSCPQSSHTETAAKPAEFSHHPKQTYAPVPAITEQRPPIGVPLHIARIPEPLTLSRLLLLRLHAPCSFIPVIPRLLQPAVPLPKKRPYAMPTKLRAWNSLQRISGFAILSSAIISTTTLQIQRKYISACDNAELPHAFS